MARIFFILLLVCFPMNGNQKPDQENWDWVNEQSSIQHYVTNKPVGYEVQLTRPANWEAGNKIRVQVLKNDTSIHQWDTHLGGAFVFSGSTLVYSKHQPNAPGCGLVAFDLEKRAKLWGKDLYGIPVVTPVESGSQYENKINLRVDSEAGKITVLGNESRGHYNYVETVDLKTGNTISVVEIPKYRSAKEFLEALKNTSNSTLYDFRRLLIAAEKAGFSSLVPELIKIAEQRSLSKDHDFVFRALHTADALGDIEEKLFEYALDYEKDPLLSKSAINILGRNADAKTMTRLMPLKDVASEGNRVQAAWAGAERVRNLQLEFEKLEIPQKKVELVLNNFRSNWNLIADAPKTLDSCSENPQAAWSQKHFRNLSQQHPKLVAKLVFDRKDYETDSGKQSNIAYRKFLARFLSEESGNEFNLLMAAVAVNEK